MGQKSSNVNSELLNHQNDANAKMRSIKLGLQIKEGLQQLKNFTGESVNKEILNSQETISNKKTEETEDKEKQIAIANEILKQEQSDKQKKVVKGVFLLAASVLLLSIGFGIFGASALVAVANFLSIPTVAVKITALILGVIAFGISMYQIFTGLASGKHSEDVSKAYVSYNLYEPIDIEKIKETAQKKHDELKKQNELLEKKGINLNIQQNNINVNNK